MKNYLILLTLAIVGCNNSNDEHIFTLYSSYQNNRQHVATFDITPTSWGEKKVDQQFMQWYSEGNFNDCNKVAKLLQKEWDEIVKTQEIKYWCEKGRFRK